MTLLHVPFPAPVVDGECCERCDGAGVLATNKATMDLGEGRALLVDVFCPACGGCGSGDGHASCGDGVHTWDDDEDFEDELGWCPSCSGRGWNAVVGFGSGEDGPLDAEPDDEGSLQMAHLRVPCGCQEHRMETLRQVEL